MQKTRQAKLTLATCVLLGLFGITARGATVELESSSRETHVGVPIYVQISVNNASRSQPPVVPEVDGVEIRSVGIPRRSSFMSSINGRVTHRVSTTYTYAIVPDKVGRHTIPPFTVAADGKTYKTRPFVFVVTKSQAGDLLFVEVVGNRNSVYVGQELRLTLRIWLKPFHSNRFKLTLSGTDMWSMISLDLSKWGVFRESLVEALKNHRYLGGREVLRKDSEGIERSYYLYEITHTIYPRKIGEIDGSKIRIIVSYPTQLGRSRDMFNMGSLRVTNSKNISRTASFEPIEIKPIPLDGRPGVFTGAVGRYEISTTAAPKDVYVGDPVTLRMTIRGNGRMDLLRAPDLSAIKELTRNFKVPSEPLAGEVKGDEKVFTTSIRPKNADVKQIPAIPFASFDPQSEKFVITRSDPVEINVRKAERLAMSRVVSSGSPGGITVTNLTENTSGIYANYPVSELLTSHRRTPGWDFFLVMLAAPCALVLVLLGRWLQRIRGDSTKMRCRSARSRAMRRLAQTSGCDDIAATLIEYVADRLGVLAVGMTRSDMIERLRSTEVSQEAIEQVNSLLTHCEELHYSPNARGQLADLIARGRGCIERLERERL